ncbi:MAG: hypothetical protein NZR01_07105 [Bryobacteraceae bacterium]|nr:hypothetical protein [Bryobacteraceae bacterium]
MRYRRRQDQRGFALLFVFALAAAALVMLYLEMPRVAFEHQRDKEALLVDRGEEYIRAIQLYVQKFNRYPQTLEELETTNNIRFLRKRFRDPITGSDEWRLIHIDAAGQYIDSLVHKRQEPKRESAPHVLQANVQGIGVSAEAVVPGGEGQAQNPALRRTASDRIIPGMPGQGGGPPTSQEGEEPPQEGPSPPPESPAPPQPGTETVIRPEPGSPGAAPGQNPFRMPGNVPPGMMPGGQPPLPGQPGTPAQQPPTVGQPSIGYGGGIGSPAASPPPAPGTTAGMAPGMGPPPPPAPGAPGYGGPAGSMSGGQRPGVPNEALQAIQRVLTRQTAQAGIGGPGLIGGGIAGVASKADMEGIRVYNNATNYKEWEFLFDFRKAMQAAGMGGALGQGQQGMPGQPAGQQQSPFERPGRSSSGGFTFGGSGGQGGRSSFGSGFGGFGSQPQPAPPPRP